MSLHAITGTGAPVARLEYDVKADRWYGPTLAVAGSVYRERVEAFVQSIDLPQEVIEDVLLHETMWQSSPLAEIIAAPAYRLVA